MSESLPEGAVLSGEDEDEDEEEEEPMGETSSGVVLEGEDDSEEEEDESHGDHFQMTSPHQGEVTLGEDEEEEDEEEDMAATDIHSTTEMPGSVGHSHDGEVGGTGKERVHEEIPSQRMDQNATKERDAPPPEDASKGVFGKFRGFFKKKKKEGGGEQKGAISRFAGKLFKSSKKPEPQLHAVSPPVGESSSAVPLVPPASKGAQSTGLGVKVAVGSLWRKSKKVLGIAGKKDKRILYAIFLHRERERETL
jgi:hypothetical protein